jgi:hypothetical protein
MKAGLALALALLALAAVVASAAAGPPTPATPYDGPFTPVTLEVTTPVSDALLGASTGPAATLPAAIVEAAAPPVPTAGRRLQPAASVNVVVKPKPKPKPRPKRAAAPRATGGGSVRTTGHVLRGPASWYCNRDGSRAQLSACHYQYPDTGAFNAYAAAGPRLRAALGPNWRGRVVSVDGIAVRLVDWCQCYKGQSNEKLLDLYYDVFLRTGGQVTIRW